MNGDIGMFSAEGIGTTVWFTIPVELPTEVAVTK
jgi:signal transduction histidine kinase